jgi:nitrate/nitrite-specific signal transduction histidine kinase
VEQDPNGYLSFDIHPILVAYVNALKELHAKYKELEEKVEKLEARNRELEAIVNGSKALNTKTDESVSKLTVQKE